ncbi:hypothetical protein U8Q05_25860 [Rhizobium ruizarguesonis]|nr:hypothetical protein U8Q05_25860 [Rhizobium ruizarguesonis]
MKRFAVAAALLISTTIDASAQWHVSDELSGAYANFMMARWCAAHGRVFSSSDVDQLQSALLQLEAKFKPEVQAASRNDGKRSFEMRAEEATIQGRCEVTWGAIGEDYDLLSYLSREDRYRFRSPPI